MMQSSQILFVNGFSKIGIGAGTEFFHQIIVWRKPGAGPSPSVLVLPSEVSMRNEALPADHRKPWERSATRVY